MNEALSKAKEALEAAKRWHQGDKWRNGETEQRNSWEDHLVLLDNALSTLSALQEARPELTPKWEGEFATFPDWVNRAQRVLTSPSHRPAICVDAKGRRCTIGSDFMRARDEEAFPVRYFWECTVAAHPQPAQQDARDAERKETVQAFETAIKDFVSGYEIDTGEGIYQPNEHERFLIDMAIRDALNDDDFGPVFAALSAAKEKP